MEVIEQILEVVFAIWLVVSVGFCWLLRSSYRSEKRQADHARRERYVKRRRHELYGEPLN